MKNAQIGQEVVRSKGDYVVGRTGEIVAIDSEKNRAQVQWKGDTKTWVSFGSLELTSIPYEIIRQQGKYPKYVPRFENRKQEQFETRKVTYNGIEVDAINFGKVVDVTPNITIDLEQD